MSKTFIKGIILPIAIMFVTSCQKETEQLSEESSKKFTEATAKAEGNCDLISYDFYNGIADEHHIDNFSYKDGLIDEWNAYYGIRYKMIYDKKRKIIASKAYLENDLLYNIQFIYENNKVIKEIWRDAITNELLDEVFLTYNNHGDLIRNESFLLDNYTTYTYTANGRLKTWQIFFGGPPVEMAEYSYNSPHKNPYTTITGLDYSFGYTNSGFGRGLGNRWYSSEKITLYDEHGAPFTYYDQNPDKTVWQDGKENYPIFADYTDRVSSLHITNSFEYDCNKIQNSKIGCENKSIIDNNNHGKSLKSIFNNSSKSATEKIRAVKFNNIGN